MSPGAAPRTSSLRTNTRNDFLTVWKDWGEYTDSRLLRSMMLNHLRSAVNDGASNGQLAALVLGCVDALDVIDSDPRPTTP